MTTAKNSLNIGDVNISDTKLIYSYFIALQVANKIIPINDLFSF